MTVRTKRVMRLGVRSASGSISRIRGRLGRRGTLVLAAVAVLAAAAALNWSWLVAVGVVPLLLSLAPCAAMCALSLCKGQGTSCSSKDAESAQTG